MFVLLAFSALLSAQGMGNSPQVVINDPYLVATDALGRSLPGFEQTGPPKPDRWVGLFYWQWHGDDRFMKDYNMTDFLQTHPRFMDFDAYPPGGPNNPTWYWGQPIFGYYRSTDPWVIRRQLALISHAGVDFLFLDYTNGSVYDAELQSLLQVAQEMKKMGATIPKLVFFLNSEPDWKAEWLYTKWYKPGHYDDMWFRWEGKPLIMSPEPTDAKMLKDPALLGEIQSHFTWRPTWALFGSNETPTRWRFMDTLQPDGRPRAALGPDGKREQIVVNKSMGGPLFGDMQSGGVSTYPGHVPTYNDQWLSGEQAKGLFFQHSWGAAQGYPAPMLLVTGWNEWKASVWESPGVVMLGRTTVKGQGHIVDEFNMDFNRDIEPMKGGYGDDYYCQLLANMRLYKGMLRPQTASAPKKIRLNGPASQWDNVRPVFLDHNNSTAHRDWPGTIPGSHYSDSSARNDIILSQVARDARDIYFHVRTSGPLTQPKGPNWMLLFLSSGKRPNWNGYDFLINRNRVARWCSIERCLGGWNWKTIGRAEFRISGRDLYISVDRRELGLQKEPVSLDFKWADDQPEIPDLMDFYTKGTVAPDGRLNYRYTAHP
jgi:hypothetical protein